MESRRYQTFDLWRRRFRTLNRALIVPALNDQVARPETAGDLQAVARDLGRTVPHLSLLHAAGYRVRRNYGYLFGVTLFAWLLKLEVHPHPAGSAAELVRRAGIAFVPGRLMILAVVTVIGALLLVAAHAPTGDMLDWQVTSPRWRKWLRRGTREGGGDVA